VAVTVIDSPNVITTGITLGSTITSDWQVEFMSTNGTITMGPGTPYGIKSFDFQDTPPLRSTHAAKAMDHGTYRGNDYIDTRLVNLDLVVTGTSNANLISNMQALASATVPSLFEQPLTYRFPGDVLKTLFVRPEKRSNPLTYDRAQFGSVDATLQFWALIPFIFEANQNKVVGSVSSTGLGGRTYPRTYPLTFGTPGYSNSILCNNLGTFNTYPLVVINGPCANPRLTNTTTGMTMAFNVTLGTTDVLTIDMLQKSAFLNLVSARYLMTTDSTYYPLQPGSNQLSYIASSGSTSTCTVYFRSAWA
jgi:hypothetical protein